MRRTLAILAALAAVAVTATACGEDEPYVPPSDAGQVEGKATTDETIDVIRVPLSGGRHVECVRFHAWGYKSAMGTLDCDWAHAK